MKFVMIAASLLLATSASAQDSDAPAAAAETQATFTIDTPIAVLMADERAKAVVDANLPGIDQHPAYDQFKAMSLKAVQPFSGGMITKDVLAKIAAGLAEIK
ncbi:hypothetical protein OAS19_06415 [Altererythrobacter sp.]|nr:hypothetical protein [Altererythrobacter sp.]